TFCSLECGDFLVAFQTDDLLCENCQFKCKFCDMKADECIFCQTCEAYYCYDCFQRYFMLSTAEQYEQEDPAYYQKISADIKYADFLCGVTIQCVGCNTKSLDKESS